MGRAHHYPDVAALRAQQACGFRLLRFRPELEAAFHEHYRESGRGFRLAMMCLGFVMVLGTPLYNELLEAPRPFRQLAMPVVYGIQLPALALGIAGTALPRWRRHADAILIVAALILACGFVIERAVGVAHGFDIPLEFIGVLVVAILFIARLRFRTFLPAALAMTAVMIANEALLVGPEPSEWYRMVAMLVLITIAFVGGYSQEYLAREAWLEHGILEHLSTHDALTGLFNRRAVETAVERALRQAARDDVHVGIALVDLDFFKRYNDEYGHAQGDEFLRRLAALLREVVRRPLDCVGRLGGEEFLVAWHGSDPGEMQARAEWMREALRSCGLVHAGSPVATTMSIGLVTLKPDWDTRLQPLLEAADRLLYRAKQAGRDRVVAEHWPGARAAPRAHDAGAA